MPAPIDFTDALKERNEQLQSLMRLALEYMDKGEYGTARRVLTAGSEKPPMTKTGVIAKDGA